MAEKKVNYTEAMVVTARQMYAELGNAGLQTIADTLKRTKRSVISKLVAEGVYQATEKAPKAEKADEGPTKKELVSQILTLSPDFPVDGLMPATKEAIKAVIAALGLTVESVEEAEEETAEAE